MPNSPTLLPGNYQVTPYTDGSGNKSAAFVLPPGSLTSGYGAPFNAPLMLSNAGSFAITAQQNASFQFAGGKTTIAATCWNADAASRTQLRTDFAAFLQ